MKYVTNQIERGLVILYVAETKWIFATKRGLGLKRDETRGFGLKEVETKGVLGLKRDETKGVLRLKVVKQKK